MFCVRYFAGKSINLLTNLTVETNVGLTLECGMLHFNKAKPDVLESDEIVSI